MPNAEKTAAVAELSEHFASSSATMITEYRGLTVKQITKLRRSLGSGATYAVVKNTLTKRAAADAGVAIDDSLLTGPTAIAFVKGDPVEAAKGLRDFARTNPLLIIKGGVLDGKVISAAEVARIADLESREVLLAKLAGAFKALPTRAAALFQAPLSQMARLAKALEEKKPVGEIPADAVPEPEPEPDAVPETAAEPDAVPETAAEAPVGSAADDVAADESAAAPADTTTGIAPETPAEPAE